MNTLKSEAFLSAITLGTVQLGLPYGIANHAKQPDQESTNLILDAAIEGGIISFDTAPTYGSSEAVIGRYFAGKQLPSIISKWSLYEEGTKLATGDLRQQIRNTLKQTAALLGVDRVPAMLLHTPLILKNHGAAVTDLLRECVRDGLVGKIGISLAVYVDREFEEFWPVFRDDLYEIVQVPLNVLDQRLIRTGMLEELRRSGKQILARSAYLQGLVFLDDAKLTDNLKHAAPWLGKLRQLAERESMTIAELAFTYVRDTPGVTSVLVGAEMAGQVRDNLALLQVKALREETREQIEADFSEVPEDLIIPTLWNLWNKR